MYGTNKHSMARMILEALGISHYQGRSYNTERGDISYRFAHRSTQAKRRKLERRRGRILC